MIEILIFFFFQAEDGIRDLTVTGVQTCALPIWKPGTPRCVLMDWNVGGSVATLVAFDDGTVSLYLSSGGGIIGAGAHARSEERRVGEECRSRWSPYH